MVKLNVRKHQKGRNYVENMLKVFLVEDEYVVREGIKNNVNWAEHGYEFSGEATDGELAFPMIQKLRPDIVITDIRMPFMDGLELSRLIKQEFPDTEIIILSGYAEFSYAKEAIRLGVAEYLTKPISGNDLIAEMDKVARRINEKRRENEIREKYLKEIEENHKAERRSLFADLVTGSRSVPELLERAAQLKVNLSAIFYNVFLYNLSSSVHEYDEYSKDLLKAQKCIDDLNDECGLLAFDRGLEGTAVLFTADTEEELANVSERYLTEFKNEMNQFKKLRYFGGVGTPVNRIRMLRESFESASRAFAHRYLTTESGIISFRELSAVSSLPRTESETLNIKEVNTASFDRSRILQFLKVGEADEVIYFAGEFIGSIGTKTISSTIFKQYITLDIYFCVCDFLAELGIDKSQIDPPDIAANVGGSREDLMDYITKIFGTAISLREQNAGSHRKDVVNSVIDFISKNYANDELSLNEIAAHVNFSPSHLSTVFSSEVGTTIVKYLTDFRMNKAKELLRCTSKKSSVISEEVGYKDPHYFSYLFKKTQGQTPTAYRGRDD